VLNSFRLTDGQKIAAWYAAFWVAAIVVMTFGGRALVPFILVGCILWSLRSPLGVIQALFVAQMLANFNSGVGCWEARSIIDTSGSTVAALKAILSITCFGRMVVHTLLQNRMFFPSVYGAGLAFVFIVAALSAATSYAVDVSLFKIGLFLIGFLTVFSALYFALRDQSEKARAWFITFAVAFIITSLPYVFIGRGFICNGSGFQGWLNQPQGFGIVSAIIATWLSSKAFFGETNVTIWRALFAVALVMVILTDSRNALLTFLVGFGLASIMAVRFHARKLGLLSLLLIVALPAAALLPQTREAVDNFFAKASAGNEYDSLAENFSASRGYLIERGLSNFEQNPLSGIGFGVASDEFSFVVVRDPIFGLPISAPTEKGRDLGRDIGGGRGGRGAGLCGPDCDYRHPLDPRRQG
jgi:O-Antigen ligase